MPVIYIFGKEKFLSQKREDENLEDRVLVTAQTPGKRYLMARCAFIFLTLTSKSLMDLYKTIQQSSEQVTWNGW